MECCEPGGIKVDYAGREPSYDAFGDAHGFQPINTGILTRYTQVAKAIEVKEIDSSQGRGRVSLHLWPTVGLQAICSAEWRSLRAEAICFAEWRTSAAPIGRCRLVR